MIPDQNSNDLRSLHGINLYRPLEEEFLLRPITRPLAQLMASTPVSPNHITVIGFLFTVTAAGGALGGLPSWTIIMLLILAIFCDKLDGDLARAQQIAGTKGQYLDGFLDALGDIILIFSLGITFSILPFFIVLAVVAPLFFVYHGVSAPFYLNLAPQTHQQDNFSWKIKIKELFSFGRVKMFLLIILCIAIDRVDIVFLLLPLLIPYTIAIFLKNIWIKRLIQR